MGQTRLSMNLELRGLARSQTAAAEHAFYREFGFYCRCARRRALLSQRIVAEQAGIGITTYRRIENGETRVTVERWSLLSRIFGVQPMSLWPTVKVAEQSLSHPG
jgi:DNA-binding XRE family transcriptional regulator